MQSGKITQCQPALFDQIGLWHLFLQNKLKKLLNGRWLVKRCEMVPVHTLKGL